MFVERSALPRGVKRPRNAQRRWPGLLVSQCQRQAGAEDEAVAPSAEKLSPWSEPLCSHAGLKSPIKTLRAGPCELALIQIKK